MQRDGITAGREGWGLMRLQRDGLAGGVMVLKRDGLAGGVMGLALLRDGMAA